MWTNNDFHINSEYTYMKYQLKEIHIKIHTISCIKHLSNISANIIKHYTVKPRFYVPGIYVFPHFTTIFFGPFNFLMFTMYLKPRFYAKEL